MNREISPHLQHPSGQDRAHVALLVGRLGTGFNARSLRAQQVPTDARVSGQNRVSERANRSGTRVRFDMLVTEQLHLTD